MESLESFHKNEKKPTDDEQNLQQVQYIIDNFNDLNIKEEIKDDQQILKNENPTKILRKSEQVVKEETKQEQNVSKRSYLKQRDIFAEIKKFKFQQIGSSQVTLWHRPTIRDIEAIKNLQQITLIVTLQGQQEDPKSIQDECKKQGIEHFHINLNGANQALLNSKATQKMLLPKIQMLFKILNDQEHRAVIHCAAGIHRTGTITYTLMRMDGKQCKEAYEGLKEMREQTYKGVGNWRITLAETALLPKLLDQKIYTDEKVEDLLKDDS
eukprot:403357863